MKTWLDGPKLAEFIRPYLGEHSMASFSTNFQREFNRWEAGKAANYYHVDQWLVKLGLYEHDIPDDCWIDPPKREKPTNHSPQVREEALRKISRGTPVKTIAEELGINERTLRGWKAGKNVRSMLQPEQLEEIRARFTRKSTRVSNAKELSKEYGVSVDRIRIIARTK